MVAADSSMLDLDTYAASITECDERVGALCVATW